MASFLPVLAALLTTQGTTERASVSTLGAQGDGHCGPSSVSYGGRFVAFESSATTLVTGDNNGKIDSFVRDRLNGATERVSVDSNGVEGDGFAYAPSISADGRFVAFEGFAANLVPGDTNGKRDIFVHDRQTGATERVSVDSNGAQASGDSRNGVISADGRWVAFMSAASDLVSGDTNGVMDVFVHDRVSGATERVSIATGGAEAYQTCSQPQISADGRFVSFSSLASTLVPGDTGLFFDVFVRDRLLGRTERASVDSSGAQAQGNSSSGVISADGRWVAFASGANNLDPADTGNYYDVFVRDRWNGKTELVSLSDAGLHGNNRSEYPSISADGRYIAFQSIATDLVSGDTNGHKDVFVRDRLLETTECASVDDLLTMGDDESLDAHLSGDGRVVSFLSQAINLVSGDSNGFADIYVRDRGSLVPGTDLCQPGSPGVLDCPCGNPPANSPRGCDNSAGTGGARLASSGSASLSFDSLVFVTDGERPTATSIVLQGSAELAGGAVFGQGVRCAGGALKRLYLKSASGGSISAPTPGDLAVSLRSAALGDVIQPGQDRWYAVYYRDPIVLGGCPAASGFNITQTQLVPWSN